MYRLPKKLAKKIEDRKACSSLRALANGQKLTDFTSNDYLGFASSESIFDRANEILEEQNLRFIGATGSRLISGNHRLYEATESYIAEYHQAEACLIFNSGYDANVGMFSSIPKRGDLVFYDEYIHASIRDGIRMSNAKAYKFKHNDLNHLRNLLNGHIVKTISGKSKGNTIGNEVYIVTESVFSMDGDSPDLMSLSNICTNLGCHLIVDEAHAVGVMGNGKGMIQELGLQSKVFARVITFGKALGSHGAAVLGSIELKIYLINFSRSLIYTTALPPHSVASTLAAYQRLASSRSMLLKDRISLFKSTVREYNLEDFFIESQSAIQSCILPGNTIVKNIANILEEKGFNVKPVLAPTVKEGEERLRFCVHDFNTKQEIVEVIKNLAILIQN